MVHRFLSLEWYLGFEAWSGTQALELGVVHRFGNLEWYSDFGA